MEDRDWNFLLAEIKEARKEIKEVKELIYSNNLSNKLAISKLQTKMTFIVGLIGLVSGIVGAWIKVKIGDL